MSNNNSPTHDDLMRSLMADLALCMKATGGPLRYQWGNTAPYPHKVWGGHEVIARCRLLEDAEFFAAARAALPAALRRAMAAEEMAAFLRDEGQAKGEEIARLRRELEGKDKALALLNAGFERQCELAGGLKQQARRAEAEVQRLQAMVEGMAARITAQSDLLSQRAGKQGEAP